MMNLPLLDTIPLSIPAPQVFENDAYFSRYTQRLKKVVRDIKGMNLDSKLKGLDLFLEARTQFTSIIKAELESYEFPIFIRFAWLQEILQPGWNTTPVLAIVSVRVEETAVLKVDFLDELYRDDIATSTFIRSIIGAIGAIAPTSLIYDRCNDIICDDDLTNNYHMSFLPSSLVEGSRCKFNNRVIMPESAEAGRQLLENAVISPKLTEAQRRWCAEVADTLTFFKENGIPRITDPFLINYMEHLPHLSDNFVLANDDDVLCCYMANTREFADDDYMFSCDIYTADDVRILSQTCRHIKVLQGLMKCAGQVWRGRTV